MDQAFAQSLKERTEFRRNELRALHERGSGGLETVSGLSVLADEIASSAFQRILKIEYEDRPDDCGLCLVAVGGYGRGQLCPFSDVDLLFLHEDSLSPKDEKIITSLIPMLWDTGWKVGHAVRSLSDCADLPEEEIETRTAFLESRLVAGKPDTFRSFRETALDMRGPRLEHYLLSKIEERANRLEHYGRSVYLLEPDVKTSPGTLRDYHQFLWLTLAAWGTAEMDELIAAGKMEDCDGRDLTPAVDFFLRLRNELHFQSGKDDNQLTFRNIDRMASRFGYRPERGRPAGDALMAEYYRHAANLARIADGTERHTLSEARSVRRPIHAEAPLPLGFVIRDGEIAVPEGKAPLCFLREDSARIFGAFRVARQERLPLRSSVIDALTRIGKNLEAGFRNSRVRQAEFLDLLGGRNAAPILDILHRTKILFGFLPELENMEVLTLDDLYHRYTVDGHTIRCLYMLDDILKGEALWGGGDNGEIRSYLKAIAEEVSRLDLVRLALLFHDAGKGRGENHAGRGADLLTRALERFDLSSEHRDFARFLVEGHLVMTNTAFRRDLENPGVIEAFTDQVHEPERLRALLVLSVADIMGVAPGLLSEWKIVSLWYLYLDAMNRMEGGRIPAGASRHRSGTGTEELFARFGEETVHGHLDGLPVQYRLFTSPDLMALHLVQAGLFDGNRPVVSIDSEGASDGEKTDEGRMRLIQVALCARDRMGLFRDLVKAFTLENLEINRARLFTRKDGIVFDSFTAIDRMRVPFGEERGDLLRERLEKVLSFPPGKGTAPERGKRVPRIEKPPDPNAPKRFERQTYIRVRNYVSDTYTVIDFHHPDQIDLLPRVAEFLTDTGLDIQYARIYHEGKRLCGAFHVVDSQGRKLEDLERIGEIERMLEGILDAGK